MKFLNILLILIIALVTGCAGQVPEGPGDVVITPGLNPMTQLSGYQVQLFAAPDSVVTAATITPEALVWLDFTPPLKFAGELYDGPDPVKVVFIRNDKVAYTDTNGVWHGTVNCIISALPGKYSLALAAVGLGGAVSAPSNLNLIEVK
jgi:hypothetical protein